MKKEIPQFTQEEVQAAIDKLKKGKASDNNGIWAEDIKTCDATTKEMIRQIFNEVLKQDDCTPETWRRQRIKVIYKKEMWNRLETTVQIVLDNYIQQTIQQTRPSAI